MKVFLVLICCFSLAFCQPFLDYSEYYNAMLDYALYDYYDWVCVNTRCQLCDLLTGECCNPINPNCFLPDSCANNPCLAGGTCITTRTVSDNPDFVCTCKKGLTGKYCQLIDEFDPPITMPIVPPSLPVPVPEPAPVPIPAPFGPRQTGYGQQMQPQMQQQMLPQMQQQMLPQLQPQMQQQMLPQLQPQMQPMMPMQPQFGSLSPFAVQSQPTQQQPFGRRSKRSTV